MKRFDRMAVFRLSFLLVFSNFVWMFARGDTEVFCQLRETCILPCSFHYDDEAVIHWIQGEQKKFQAHSFYHDRDQLAFQDQPFQGRTSLFKDQIASGNVSLRLTGVTLRDQGRYHCYTSTISGSMDSYINLNVDAPVKKINLKQEENKITCSSDGIYPKPELKWITDPQSSLQFTPAVQQMEDNELFSISSSLILSDSDSDLDYTCTISTRRNQKRTTLFKSTNISGSGTEIRIPCKAPKSPIINITWRFNRGQIILTKSEAESYKASDKWEKHVKEVLETGLTLNDLSSNQEGKYMCEISNTEETYMSNFFLQIKAERNIAAVAAGVTIGAVVVAVGVLIAVLVWMRYRITANHSPVSTEEQPQLERSINLVT